LPIFLTFITSQNPCNINTLADAKLQTLYLNEALFILYLSNNSF
jgi:hypothetical protein